MIDEVSKLPAKSRRYVQLRLGLDDDLFAFSNPPMTTAEIAEMCGVKQLVVSNTLCKYGFQKARIDTILKQCAERRRQNEKYPLIAELKFIESARDRDCLRLRVGVDQNYQYMCQPLSLHELGDRYDETCSTINKMLWRSGYDRDKIIATRKEFARRALDMGDQEGISAWFESLPERIRRYVRLSSGMDEEGHFVQNPMTQQEVAKACGLVGHGGSLTATLWHAGIPYAALAALGAADYFEDVDYEGADDFMAQQNGTSFKSHLHYTRYSSYVFDDIRTDPRSRMGIEYLRKRGEKIKHGMLVLEAGHDNEKELRQEIRAIVEFGREIGRRAIRKWNLNYGVTVNRVKALCVSESTKAEIAVHKMFSLAQRCELDVGDTI